MTFVTNQAIFKVNQELLSLSAFTPKIHGKVECFNISRDVKYNSKYNMPRSYQTLPVLSTSPVVPAMGDNTGLYATPQHYNALIAAFSASFPDFDFSSVCPWNFKLIQSPEQAQIDINWKFQTVLSDSEQLMSHIWGVLEKEILPAGCNIYMYESDRPDAFSAMGAVFNLSYFFLNEKMNKVVLIHLREGANEFGSGSDEDADVDDEIDDQFWI
ncbi:putative repressor of rna polymerase iii transcription [Tritrichomonas foetus]|uniref:Repressor of rna polymerase iii transcription n=1 Tax=Tritrichomonas foetus TaxID=1144522 RepID=A0A1J4JMI8_9EUKA|nr:putative repressor of rna polymerase iii transcription [Tritrichomonas foetus]|eukprot:OHS98468.1 putative repressor of rna polymerase iii transcription [Tritrichomonas foetus]